MEPNEDYYCILPAGNKDEFLELDCELIRRKVNAHVSMLASGGRLYRISWLDLFRLPSDEKGFYMGDEESGHSIYKMPRAEYNRVQWGGSDWISLLQISQEAKNAVEASRNNRV